MSISLIKEYEKWFSKAKQKHKNFWPRNCDHIFDHSIKEFKKMSKENEKKVFLDIDKEITKKKQDRATLTKAKALAKNKDVESKYIELRFEEIWEEIVEEKLKPTIGLAMQKILMAQSKYEKENQPKPIGGDSLFGDK